MQVTDEGLFLYDSNEDWVPVESVFCDQDGLFILLSKRRDEEANDRCLNGHKIYCTNCWGCANPWCKGRCKCAEWPFTGMNK